MELQVEQELKNWFSDAKKVAIAGIGNPIRSDDYVGLKIVQDLQEKVSSDVLLLECETVPETYISDIQQFQPTHVLLIDAAFLNLKEGEMQLVKSDQIASFPAITTHLLPLHIFCDLIQSITGAKILLLLIQPGNIAFGEGLTLEVEETAKKVTSLLLDFFGTK